MTEAPDPDEPLPLVSLTRLTEVFDLQTSLVDELLGGPLDLLPSGTGELVQAGPDPELVIHPDLGTAKVRVGWTQEQVEASLGAPDSIHDARMPEHDLDLGVSLNYTRLGMVVDLQKDVVAKIVFHSGTYSGGLLPLEFEPYAGVAYPDLDLTTLTETELRARLGEPSRVLEPVPDLAELFDERPTRNLVYPGWEWRFYEDGTLESVSVPKVCVL